jgi:hypothetical protein
MMSTTNSTGLDSEFQDSVLVIKACYYDDNIGKHGLAIPFLSSKEMHHSNWLVSFVTRLWKTNVLVTTTYGQRVH